MSVMAKFKCNSDRNMKKWGGMNFLFVPPLNNGTVQSGRKTWGSSVLTFPVREDSGSNAEAGGGVRGSRILQTLRLAERSQVRGGCPRPGADALRNGGLKGGAVLSFPTEQLARA